ncbi:Lrp/AsnC ligand binding domain-containing protein [Desulfurococcus amylolyticus]|uniref:Transcription regulator AsnC-type n=1 Tax=Desulfurococcus amylolyticus DSM 16532 TaxID=768672 RepID=I3XTD1_DESAM|nr:Lrp/AsnC ligand binding domain-containing protein [Desulfurococcus amylolyticus]AFL67205.1 Transcription regulator AsnC-type [Desulfurococcus amylolyticus DSM 16532]
MPALHDLKITLVTDGYSTIIVVEEYIQASIMAGALESLSISPVKKSLLFLFIYIIMGSEMAKSSAIILLQTEIGTEAKVLDELFKIPEVKEAYVVYGTYDIVLKIETDALEKVREIVTNKIRRFPDIRTTVTMIVVEERIRQ